MSLDNLSYSTPAAAAVVPEPGEWAIMGMMGTSVCGLMVRARRKAKPGISRASLAQVCAMREAKC